jgi:hypothetical protein
MHTIPKRLSLTVSSVLRDGAGIPFDLVFLDIRVE